MKRSKIRIVLWAGTGLILAFLVIMAVIPNAIPVDTAAISQGPLLITVEDEGQTRVKEVYIVSAPITGRVLRIEKHAGDEVIGGETVVANIEPIDPTFLDVRSRAQAEATIKAAEAASALAEADLMRADAALDYAEAELKRAEPLAARGTISAAQLDRVQLEYRTRQAERATADAALEVTRYELETARALLIGPEETTDNNSGRASQPPCCVPVKAPVSGRILNVLNESETVVAAGMAIMEIGDPLDIEIVADLLSSDAVKVEAGQRVIIDNWGGTDNLEGRVRLIEPSGFTKTSALGITEQRVNTLIDFDEPPERRAQLGHGFRVEVRIVIWEKQDALRVPVSALFREQGEWAVFTFNKGRARLRPVKIGPKNERYAEVVEGLEPSEQVILHPTGRIEDGIRVKKRKI